jgi:glycosyltransferase involved in cell wall biosynthesis
VIGSRSHAALRTRSGLEFHDTVAGGTTSLSMVGQIVREDLLRRDVRSGPSTPRLRRPAPLLSFYLAHYLGHSTLAHPELLRPRLRALLVGWEIEQLTQTLLEELAGADVLLGVSEFNSEVFRRHFPDTPVLTVPVCPPLPERAERDRARWGIPEDVTAFLNVFQPASGIDRKNPIDAYQAFAQAFPGRQDVRLVFKVHGGFEKNPDERDLTGEEDRAREFLALCAGDERVILVDELVTYEDLLSLMASCDVYVSLARAEGLGLPVLEAMAMGVPTVCMAYTGHLDFVSEDTNRLVPFDVVDIAESASHFYHPRSYPDRPRWAQPRLTETALCLRELADQPDLRTQIADRARRAALDYQRRSRESRWVERLEELLTSHAVLARHEEREAAFQRVVARDRAVWLLHERSVRRARRSLTVRTRLGRVKRLLLGRAR